MASKKNLQTIRASDLEGMEPGEAVETAKDLSTGAIERIVTSVRGFIDEAEGLLRATSEFSSQGLNTVKGQFENKLQMFKGSLTDLEKTTVERYRAAATGADEYVHRSPWSAIGVAVAVGLVVGYLGNRPAAARPAASR